MTWNTAGPRPDEAFAPDYYQHDPRAGARQAFAPQAFEPQAFAPQQTFAPPAAPSPPRTTKKPATDSQRRSPKSRVDEWMEVDFKFGGSRIKRKAVALILLGLPAPIPLFFMLPALVTLNSNTFAVSVDDTLGTGAEVCLFLCLLVTPMVTLTGQHWFVPLRRWYGIMMAACSVGDAVAASITDDFAGGVLGRVAGHAFELMGFFMVMLVIPIVCTSNPWAQRKLGKYWKRFQRLTYVIWGLLACHLMLLEGFGIESGDNGSGFAGDGDAVFHQRFYQYAACSLFLLTLRVPPVKRWIAARQQEGRGWLVWVTVAPIFAIFVIGFAYILNEQFFKGIDSFTENPSSE
jgi:DMSO/TMAO reductase YedYZ heme-binding membrane subunit